MQDQDFFPGLRLEEEVFPEDPDFLPADFFGVVFAAGFEGVFFFAPSLEDFFGVESCLRVRRAASTRLPMPRCSRASWVGVDVDPDIFVSGFASVSVFVSVVEVLPSSLLESLSAVASLPDDSPDDGGGALVLPPTRIAAPVPISLRSLRALHSGQDRLTESLIDWNSSKAWPHPSQT